MPKLVRKAKLSFAQKRAKWKAHARGKHPKKSSFRKKWLDAGT